MGGDKCTYAADVMKAQSRVVTSVRKKRTHKIDKSQFRSKL